MDDFTRRARKTLNEYAPIEANRLGHKFVSNAHFLLGMIRAEDFQFLKELVVGSIFSKLRVDAKRLATELEKRVEPGNSRQTEELPSNGFVQEFIQSSRQAARQLNHQFIGSEHVLLALLQDENSFVSATLA
jgi:ATP-dependent Clp protease ATP-binding subunit ClpC